jgi:prolycopene isomerase
MKFDVIVIGGGMGGLTSATKLARHGRRVLLLEKDAHIGGTSHVFKRKGYTFPMGPLSFGYPNKVRQFLNEMGVSEKIDFHRSHFRLISPLLDILYSAPFSKLKEQLKKTFPQEDKLDPFFARFEEIISVVKDVCSRDPEHLKSDRIQAYSGMSSGAFLNQYFSDEHLINFLGSMGTHPPRMSLLNLALMWNVMSIEGIWFPSCGIHGMVESIKQTFLDYGGTLRTGSPVRKIRLKKGSAEGVECEDGQVHTASWIVSNADYKSTFFELLDREEIPQRFLGYLEKTPYTQSELCVYLGIDPQKVDFSAMRASHLFYRRAYDPKRTPDLEDFSHREMEICRWSDKMPEFAPDDKAALVLRIGFPYAHFARFRTGEKRRPAGYKQYKEKLAWALVRTAEHILPGLSSAVEVLEAATPISYRDWGQRYQGSIAGWTWDVKSEPTQGGKILVVTPVPGLLMAGIYAASELFMGGVPTAMYTGSLAADFILKN